MGMHHGQNPTRSFKDLIRIHSAWFEFNSARKRRGDHLRVVAKGLNRVLLDATAVTIRSSLLLDSTRKKSLNCQFLITLSLVILGYPLAQISSPILALLTEMNVGVPGGYLVRPSTRITPVFV